MDINTSLGFIFLAGMILMVISLYVAQYDNKVRNIIAGFFCVLGLFVLLSPFAIITKVHNAKWEYPDKPYATERIVSLNDSNMVQGKTYLRKGYVNEYLYYQYMVALNGGGYKANKVKSNDTTIYYDTNNYRVEWCEKRRKWLWFYETQKYNKIYIPDGSIINDFNIDLN